MLYMLVRSGTGAARRGSRLGSGSGRKKRANFRFVAAPKPRDNHLLHCRGRALLAAGVHPAQIHRNIRRNARLSVDVKAEKSGLQRLLQPFEGFSKEEEVSFRWDPANLRWAKSKGKLADDAEMMITPLIGEPYMVSVLFCCT